MHSCPETDIDPSVPGLRVSRGGDQSQGGNLLWKVGHSGNHRQHNSIGSLSTCVFETRTTT